MLSSKSTAGNMQDLFVYEGHLGHLYTSDVHLSPDELRCDCCGDYDHLVGHACSRKEAWELFKDYIDTGQGGWDPEYIKEFVDENWEE